METYQAPTKEQVREYLQRRFASNGPLPSLSEIRSELGWNEPHAADGKPASCCRGTSDGKDRTV
ncbi:hypothetical protein [Noviherbaspirillum sp. ST9]|uniref:hypothetical protein n=1 Tax=Noviherbaspirillum sp. ST9 TaxID=3401606 RepID=UPI003B586D18